MDYISLNINYLVNKKNIAQDAFGDLFGLKRGAIGSYIKGKAKPKIETLQKISEYFDLKIDDLVNINLEESGYLNGKQKEYSNDKLEFSELEILTYIISNFDSLKNHPIIKTAFESEYWKRKAKELEGKQ